MSTNKKEHVSYLVAAEATHKGQVTEEQINEWKAQYPRGIFRIVSEDDNHVGYFRNPYRGDVNLALAQANAKKPLAVVEEFGKALWLGGSEAILNDDDVWLGVTAPLRAKMNGVNAVLENL
jgi:hypothetical protein